MGFNHIGFYTISPGQVQYPGIAFNYNGTTGGDDVGAQFIMANPIDSSSQLDVDIQEKVRAVDGKVDYYVRVTNSGPNACSYDLSGGGLS